MAPVLVLAEHNVNAIVVRGDRRPPLMGFNQVGITVLAGVGTDVRTAVDAYLSGGLPQSGSSTPASTDQRPRSVARRAAVAHSHRRPLPCQGLAATTAR